MLPEPFVKSLTESLGATEAEKLLTALDTAPVTSIRFNPFKVASKPKGEQVPWNRYGYYLDQRPVFTLDVKMHGGVYYVQEASSMFVEELYRQAVGDSEGIKLLDLCAAPGGKATLYSTLVGMNGLVVANEPLRTRAFTLADNIKRWGLGNTAVTCNDPEQLGAYEQFFDVLAIDAPCSGEGMFRKNDEARCEWSADNVSKCAARQKRIIADSWACLKPGGILIYSTCTFNRTEDEEVVEWVNQNFNCEPITISIPKEWGIIQNDINGINTFHFYPHLVRGEGFFAAILRKGESKNKPHSPKARKEPFKELRRNQFEILQQWVKEPEYMRFMEVGDGNMYGYYRNQYGAVKTLAEGLNMIYSGVSMGQLFGNTLRPDHALALFHDLNRENTNIAELETADALNYLRKQNFNLGPLKEGLNLICSDSIAIGWSKRIGNRANSLLPNSFRIFNI